MEGIVWESEARSLPGGLFIPWSGVSQRFYPVHPCTAVISVLHWHKAYISYFPGRSGRLEILIHFRRSMLFPY